MTRTDRRRALMGQGSRIPPGYVKDGLVFFLDGRQLVGDSRWTDLVGGRVFELIDCERAEPGVIFNGASSIGLYDRPITGNWENETIEVAFAGADSNPRSILGQPDANGAVGISMLASANDRGYRTVGIGADGTLRTFKWMPADSKTVSAHAGLCVANKRVISDTQVGTLSKNEAGITTLGYRFVGTSTGRILKGTIYAVRIYNRRLTEAEMLQNQQADLERYGIGI